MVGIPGGSEVFRDLPPPEPGHDWHALPVDGGAAAAAPPARRAHRRSSASSESRQAAAAVVCLRRPRWRASWHLRPRFRSARCAPNLADPITPLLATGAVASALLGSPLDAALVGGVLLANAALSAEQQLHAERILRRLLAVQDPLARRRVGPLDEQRHEKVAAKRLRPGDIIEVHADEVIPADARLIERRTSKSTNRR